MKRFTFLFALLSACGGPAFEVQNIAPVEDAGTDSDFNPSVSDVIIPPPDGRAAETGGFESDAGHDVVSSDVISNDAQQEPDTTPANDAAEVDAPNDAWPSDVILVPYCTDPPYPAFSQVCYDWGTSHGWTVRACCMPDHTCGTVVGGKCNPA